jgi:hypothetical protein
MQAPSPSRKPLALCLVILFTFAVSAVSHASGWPGRRPQYQQAPPGYQPYPPQYAPRVPARPYPGAPVLRGPMPGQPRVIIPGPYYGAPIVPTVRNPRGDHLAEWMDKHRNLTPQQQQQALASEPGFRELPPQTQQREMQRLAQLNSMAPQQRQRILTQNEYVERMNPQQREQFRGTMQQLGMLPPDQRHIVSSAFRQLRNLPPNQRMAAASRIPLNDAQRSTLFNLIRIEPMLPPPEPMR